MLKRIRKWLKDRKLKRFQSRLDEYMTPEEQERLKQACLKLAQTWGRYGM